MAPADEKLCLQWNDFKENVISAFGDLRQNKEFTDVTLACEDGQQVEAHKVVLVGSSPFFQNLLKRIKNPHPLIYMRGVTADNLMAMVDFFYHGETNVYQENLDSFLVLAEELQLKGLGKKQTAEDGRVPSKPTKQKSQPTSVNCRSVTEQCSVNKDVFSENGLLQATSEKALIPTETLDQQVKSMMTFSENAAPYGRGRARICKVCGKEGSCAQVLNHIEAHHIAGISIPCGHCGQVFRTRGALTTHKSRHHINQ